MSELGCASSYTAKISWALSPELSQDNNWDGFYLWLHKLVAVQWSRVLDDTSTATVEIAYNDFDSTCCDLLSNVEPWSFTIGLYRDDVLVWFGPITRVTSFSANDRVVIDAADIFAYLDRSTPQTEILDVSQNAEDYINTLLTLAWNVPDKTTNSDPWRIRDNYQYEATGVPVGPRDIKPYTFYIGEEIRDIARLGVDFTVIGRTLYVFPEKNRAQYTGTFLKLYDTDFSDGVQIVYFGADTANAAVMTAADGSWQTILWSPDNIARQGPLWTIEDPGRVGNFESDEALQTIIDQRAITPRGIVVPSESTLLPTAKVDINDLMAGIRIDVYAKFACSVLADAMKLARVDVAWSARQQETGERISISLVTIPEEIL